MAHLGIDIGGTKTAVCIGTLDGNILAKERFATCTEEPFEKGELSKIKEIVERFSKHGPIESIGISHPGPISIKKGMILNPPNLPSWHHTPVVEIVQNAFSLPVYFQNDANAAALAEYYFGKRQGAQNLIYLTASTGMGAGIIANGTLLEGASDTAGEVAYMTLNTNGPPFRSGLKGTFEAYCGGAALANRWRDKAPSDIQKEFSTRLLIESAKKGEAFALEAWSEFTERMAQGIGILLMTLNPEVILLGTIADHAQDFLFKPLKEKLAKYALQEVIDAATIETRSLNENLPALSGLATIKSAQQKKKIL